MVYLRYLIMANKPRIRFRGFTEDWEQRKLDELTISIGDGLHGTPKYDENGSYYFINGNNLVNSKVSVTEETKKVAFEALSNDDRRLDSTSILMSINGTIGTLARYNNESIMLGKSVAYITPKNINRDFLFYQLQGNVIQSYFYKNLTGTTIKNLGLGTIKNVIVMSTLSEEESKIGQFFYKLDQYITLHQCKLKKLNLAKKSLLQKLFPRNGSQIPGVRFKGFTDAWEQRKLSDITDVIMGQSPSSKNYTDNPNDNILVQGNADLKDGKVIPRLWTKEITKTIDKDGIILTVRAPVGDVAKTDYKVVLGRGVAGIKGNDFIYQFLQKLQYNRHWVSLSSGSTFESINSNDIKDLIIDIPSIEEQNKISMLLNNVNSIITLHQRKLERLQEVKKGLLQKMFV